MTYLFNKDEFIDRKINEELKISFQKLLCGINKKIDYKFFESISEILFTYTGNYRNKEFNLTDENIALIKDCIYIAKYYFNKGLTQKSINEILLAVIIIDFFSQDYEILEVNEIEKDIKKQFSHLLQLLTVDIGIPEDAPYNEKKLFEVYSEAKRINDYNKVISIMDNLKYHSRIFDNFEYTWKIIIKFVFYVDKNIVLSILLNENSFEKIELILSSINILELFGEILDKDNLYLIIRSSKYFFEELEDQYVKNNKLKDIPNYTEYLILLFTNTNLSFSKYIDNLRINYLDSYCYLFGWLLSRQTDFTSIFLEHMSFCDNQANAFSLGFNSHIEADTDFRSVSEIEEFFFKKEIHNYSPINYYSGYIDLFTYYYANIYSERNDFLKELNRCSKIIEEIQNSWEFENLQINWVRLFYMSLATIYTDFFFTDEEIINNIPVLFDKRNMLIQGKENINIIIAMLKDHLQYLKIQLKTSIDEHYFEVNKSGRCGLSR